MTEEVGEISILNVASGDIEIRFDGKNPMETERAKQVIQHMLRCGYALFVKQGDTWARVSEFDPATSSYVIASWPTAMPATEAPEIPEQPGVEATSEPAATVEPGEPKLRRGRPRKVKVPMEKSKAVAVGRSAGG